MLADSCEGGLLRFGSKSPKRWRRFVPRSALTAMNGCASPSSVAPRARARMSARHTGRVVCAVRRVERAAGGGRTSQLWYRTRDDVRLVAHHHHGQRRVAHDGSHLLHVLLHVGAKRLGERGLPDDHAEPHLRESVQSCCMSTGPPRRASGWGEAREGVRATLAYASTARPLGSPSAAASTSPRSAACELIAPISADFPTPAAPTTRTFGGAPVGNSASACGGDGAGDMRSDSLQQAEAVAPG